MDAHNINMPHTTKVERQTELLLKGNPMEKRGVTTQVPPSQSISYKIVTIDELLKGERPINCVNDCFSLYSKL